MTRYRGRVARQRSAKPFTAVRICSVPRIPHCGIFTNEIMLTEKEKAFLAYWQIQRLEKKKFLRKLSIGLPLGVLIGAALLINFLSGWYKRADMQLHSDASLVLVVLIAIIAIVVFITLFSARHKWDQNELYYKELEYKKDLSDDAA